MRTGDIVYHDRIVFPAGRKDEKKNRPCILLYMTENEKDPLICSCIITSQVATFNKHPDRLWLVPFPLYSERKLSFAKLDRIVFNNEGETHHTGMCLDRKSTCMLLEKVICYICTNEFIRNREDILKNLRETLMLCTLEAKEELHRKNNAVGRLKTI
jgi:hypothetical protein